MIQRPIRSAAKKAPPKGGAEINVFVKPSAEPNLFRLCRGEKTTVENKRRMKFNLFGKRERKPSADYAGAEKER